MRSPASATRDLADAYAACARLARTHYENFPVASLALPRRMRPHVAAVYAFSRLADDFADEGDRSDHERLCLLDWWLDRLRAATGVTPRCDPQAAAGVAAGTGPRGASWGPAPPGAGIDPADAECVFLAAAGTIEACRLPVSLFEDLLSAFRQDVTVRRYDQWEGLLDYCRRSANPVGRLVLRIAGYDHPALDERSDAICTALQLTNFWQDLERDWRKGRLYVPLAELEAEGADIGSLDRAELTPAWERAMRSATRRTRDLFTRGRPLCDEVSGLLALELRLTWLAGMLILDRVERARFDVFRHRPTLQRGDIPGLLAGALWWRSGSRT